MLTEEYKAELIKRCTVNKSLLLPTDDLTEVRKFLADQGFFISVRMVRGSKVEVLVYSHLRLTIPLPHDRTAYLTIPKDYNKEDCEIILRFLEEMKSKLKS